MGDGRCPECNAKLIVEVVNDEHVVRCTSCDYRTTIHDFEKSSETTATIVSEQEAVAVVAQYNGKAGVREDLSVGASALCNSISINSQECILDNVAEVLFTVEQIKILYALSDEEIEKTKRYKLKRTLERNGIL